MRIKERWKNLTLTEKMLIGMVLFLLIMISTRWEKVSQEASDGFKRIFSREATR